MRTHSEFLRALVVAHVLALALGRAAGAGDPEPPVTLAQVSDNAYAFVDFDDLFHQRTSFDDSDTCAEPSCATSAFVSETFSAGVVSGSGTGTGNASHTVTLGPEEGILAFVTAEGSSDDSASSSGSVSSPDDAPGGARVPRGGGEASGSTASGGGGSVSFTLATTVPVQLDVSASLSATGDSDARILVRSGGDVLLEGELDPQDGVSNPPGSFSGVVPPGTISVNVDANGFALECGVPCGSFNSGSASFSMTLTLSPAPQEVHWIAAAGGSWDDAANWEPEQVPGPGDTAVFDVSGSYAVTFPASLSAGVGTPRGTAGTCAATRPVRETRVRAGEITYAGNVDLSTLSDAPAAPGFRVGGEADDDDPRVFLEGGELCSVFATVGDRAVDGTAEVAVLGGTWRNEARLRVGDLGQGLLQIAGGEVLAAETRVGEIAGGEIVMDGSAALDTGALLVGAPALEAAHRALVRVVSGTARSGTTLVGAVPAVCFDDVFVATEVPCATDRDCASIVGGVCGQSQSLEVEGGTWSASGVVSVGGGTIVNDPGVPVEAPGNGALIVTGGVAAVPELLLGTDAVEPGDNATTLSLGQALVDGATLDVSGPIAVGNGGVGALHILDRGRVTASGTTTVGVPAGKVAAGLVSVPGRPDLQRVLVQGLLRIEGAVPPPDPGEADSTLVSPRLHVVRAGRVELDDNARIEASDRVRIFLGGRFTGAGTIATPDFELTEGGRLGPLYPDVEAPSGATPRGVAGRAGLTIEGDLTVAPGAVVEIAASGPGQCGHLHVTGNATLGGTLELAFVDGYLPGAGEACDVLSVEGVTAGGFARVVVRGVAEGFGYAATAGAAGEIVFEALSDATACAAGDTDGDGVADCERCDNCVDDTGDGLVDRDDPDCTPPADGGGAGLADPSAGAAALRCHAALRSASKQLATKTWKQLQKCTDGMLKCRQRRPDDARCVEKVAAKCERAAAKLAGAKGPGAKAEAKIVKACGALPPGGLLDAAGLGHAAAAAACSAAGVASLDGADDVAACVARRGLCHVGALFGAVVPRASELLASAGVAGALPCLPVGADGGEAGLGDPKGVGKRAVACQKAVGGAASKLLARALDAGGRCEGAALACVQRGDAACLAKAGAVCDRERGKLLSAEDALLRTLAKKCGEKKGEPLVPLDDLLAAVGLGFSGEADRCTELGVPALDSLDAVGTCLVAEHACREAKIREAATPRSRELSGLAGGP